MIQQHGGNIFRIENVLDFSANIDPLGVPKSVKRVLAESISEIEKYPDPFCIELRNKLAQHEKLPAENIVCGNGADDLIFRIVHAFMPKKALICAPTFSEYRRALNECGCEITEHMLNEENGFEVDGDILDKLDTSLDMCFLCTPNNPTGRLISPEMLGAISRKCEKNRIIFVCDECFMGFVCDSERYSLRNHIGSFSVILKAFTKLYAMPGIRLGYAVCGDAANAEKIRDSGQFWSVSSFAQKAGIAALEVTDYVSKAVEYTAAERAFIVSELRDMGVNVLDSAANFLLFRSVAGLEEKLLAEGILIRECSNFRGLTEGFYRIAVRTHEENSRLIAALRRCLNG